MSSNGIVFRRSYTTREFWRWCRDVRFNESSCCGAVAELARGLVDVDLGGGLLKKRVAHGGKGKRGGARLVVGTPEPSKWFLLVGYLKSETSDLSQLEVRQLKAFAGDLFACSPTQLETLLLHGALKEICREAYCPQAQPDNESCSRRRH
jgi:hypothetical protein